MSAHIPPNPSNLPLMDDSGPGSESSDVAARLRPRYEEIIRPTLQYELYNPSDRTIEFGFDGNTFKIPAHNKHWVGKNPNDPTGPALVYPKPGVLPIWTPAAVPGKKLEYGARDILAFACGPDGISGSVGPLGVRPLFSDERDELVIEEGQTAWAERKVIEAQDTKRKHEVAVADAKAQGVPPPFPGKRVLEAYQMINAYETQIGFKYLCPVCNLGFRNSQTEVYVHVISYHKDRGDQVEEAQKKLSHTPQGEVPIGETNLKGLEPEAPVQRPLPEGLANANEIFKEVGGPDDRRASDPPEQPMVPPKPKK